MIPLYMDINGYQFHQTIMRANHCCSVLHATCFPRIARSTHRLQPVQQPTHLNQPYVRLASCALNPALSYLTYFPFPLSTS